MLFKAKSLLFVLLILPGMASAANFLESWLQQNDQAVASQPGYYKGGRYSYLSGGSFSGRIQLKSGTPIFSVTPPRFSVGCGGIDVFLGSYAMVDPQYLMARAQKIIDAAPYAAFDLALKVLCESCAGTMKDIQNALDRLNQLQLDECAASKALVATIADPMVDNPQIAEDINNFKMSTGASDLWTDTVNDFKGGGGKVTSDEVDALISGCQADTKNVFGKEGSVLERIGTNLGYPTGHTDAVRALFGDIIVKKSDGYQVFFEPPCPEALDTDLERIVSGRSVTKPMSSTTAAQCTAMNSGALTLEGHSRQLLSSIYSKVKSKTALSTSEAASMETTSLPVQSLMQLAVRTGDPAPIIDEFGRLVALEKAYRMVLDLTVLAEQAAVAAKTISSKGTERKDDCRVHLLDGAVKGTIELRGRAWEARKAVRDQYAKELAKSQEFFTRLTQMQDWNKQVGSDMSRSLKSSLFLGH